MGEKDLTKIKGPTTVFIQGNTIGDTHRVVIDESGNITVYNGF